MSKEYKQCIEKISLKDCATLEEKVESLYKLIDRVEATRNFVGIINSSFPSYQRNCVHFNASNSCISFRKER